MELERSGLENRLGERQAAMASLQRELSDLKAKKDRLSKQVRWTFLHFTLLCIYTAHV